MDKIGQKNCGANFDMICDTYKTKECNEPLYNAINKHG